MCWMNIIGPLEKNQNETEEQETGVRTRQIHHFLDQMLVTSNKACDKGVFFCK